MIDTVVSCVVQTLENAGIDAYAKYPAAELDTKAQTVVCVGVSSCRNVSAGLGEYLGQREDSERGATNLYGFRMELVLSLDIYAPLKIGADGCTQCFSDTATALRALPSGLKPQALVCAQAQPDSSTAMFKCPVELHCTAYFVCTAGEEENEFTDFVLKGVLKNGQ